VFAEENRVGRFHLELLLYLNLRKEAEEAVEEEWVRSLKGPVAFCHLQLLWKVLALTTTFAGNLTIIGSVANMIVVEFARDHIQVSFWDYARFGIPITILTTVVGVAVLLLLR
jgi:Na+/H+ antiporter NhaD/arsenite permease-like protein